MSKGYPVHPCAVDIVGIPPHSQLSPSLDWNAQDAVRRPRRTCHPVLLMSGHPGEE